VERIDARLLMAYSSTLLSSILLLHYDEFVILSHVLLLCMIALPFAISRFLATPPFFCTCRQARRGINCLRLWRFCLSWYVFVLPKYGAHGALHQWHQGEHEWPDEELPSEARVCLPTLAAKPLKNPTCFS